MEIRAGGWPGEMGYPPVGGSVNYAANVPTYSELDDCQNVQFVLI